MALGKNPPATQNVGSISGSRRSPAEENGNLLQYTWLGSDIVRGAWQAIVNGLTKASDMTK